MTSVFVFLGCSLAGFLCGSVLFSSLLPKWFLGKDIQALSDDGNPGCTNVFIHCGPMWGVLCLSLDMLKAFLPVCIGYYLLGTESLLFALVMAAPVLGHALAPFNHFHGGKCIASAFGTLLALFPVTHIVLLLAALYIVFSTVLKIQPNRIRSLAVFGLFGLIALISLMHSSQYSVAIGCLLLSLVTIWRHSRYCAKTEECTASDQNT